MNGSIPAGEAAAFLAAIVELSDDAIVGKALDGTVMTWNSAAERIFGWSAADMVGHSIRSIIPADRQDEEDRILASVSRGERVPTFETIRRRKHGGEVVVAVTVSPVRDASGRIVAASKIARDITEKREAEQRIDLLMREVNHRSRNMLAVIQAITRRTAAQGGDFVARLEARIQALSVNQDLLVDRGWSSVLASDLVDVQLRILGEAVDRLECSGPPVLFAPAPAETIAMAIHELATNAVKYGALGAVEGRATLHWAVEPGPDEPWFVMTWSERDGPAVRPPDTIGFGTRIIADMPRAKLAAEVVLDYATAGFCWTLRCPLSRVGRQPPPDPATGAVVVGGNQG